MIEPKIFTVGQINRYIKNLLENDCILNSLLIRGEISNFKAHGTGHFYFTLKDAVGAVNCVMFRQYAETLPFFPENGMQVVLYGSVSLYEKTGQYQLYAEFLEPVGVGVLQTAFEQLKKQLEEEGLFDADYKREIPKNPACIAVVTSPTGAAVQDMIKVATRRNPAVKIAIFPTLVQGAQAADDIVRSIKAVNQWGKADVLIVGRGGGSIEDLWCFNEENVARAIFASEIPVISAVGHETDFTIADFVADLRAATPSAAAELATEPLQPKIDVLQKMITRLQRDMQAIWTSNDRRLLFLLKHPVLAKPLERIDTAKQQVIQKQTDLTKQMQQKLLYQKNRLQQLSQRLEAVSPYAVMGRGYAMVTTASDDMLTSITQAKIGDMVTVYLQDGSLQAQIKQKAVKSHGEKESDI